ncbi:S1C family serine protease [Natrialbaceae archaeon A-gly3]
MEETRLRRRSFLAAAGTAVLGSVAGCTEPHAGPSFETSNDPDVDREDLADGSAFTDLYEATIDAVAQVTAHGVSTDDGRARGQGSGFVYDDSHVVTNEHVVRGGEDVELQYVNGDWTTSELVGTDYHSDLAVLEVDHVPDVADPFSLTEQHPVVGQEVAAIGNPLGLEGTMTRGIVSGVNRSLPMPEEYAVDGLRYSFSNVVQTDAAVNPGNSGGPIVGLNGEVVGVVNAGSPFTNNIGFAISAALTRRVVPSLIDDGDFHHSHMGIFFEPVNRLVAEENDLSEATGILIADLEGGGPSEGVLQESDSVVERRGELIPVGGDVIVAIDGEPIPDRHALGTYLALETNPGDTISLEVIRNRGRERTTVDLELAAREEPEV